MLVSLICVGTLLYFFFQAPHAIFGQLRNAIDFEVSMETGATTIKDGFDDQLDHIRNIYDSLEGFLTQAAHQILDLVPLLQVLKDSPSIH